MLAHPMVRLARDAVRFYVRGYHRIQVLGSCTLPDSGPAILVCNHISGLDPLLLQSACPRVIGWMMAREYYENPSLKWFLDLIGVVPVERTGRDFASFRAAMRALSAGRVVGIFPEGRINTGAELLSFQTGVALLALKSGVRVYPAAIRGSMGGTEMVADFFLPQTATVIFGPPINLQRAVGSEALIEATGLIRNGVDQIYRQAAIRSA